MSITHQEPFRFRIEHDCQRVNSFSVHFMNEAGEVKLSLDIPVSAFSAGIYEDTVSLDKGQYKLLVEAIGPGGVTEGDVYPLYPSKPVLTVFDEEEPVSAKPSLVISDALPVSEHPYFDMLKKHPKTTHAIALRSQEEIDSYPEAAKHSTTRQSITYDSVNDAALLLFFPRISSDLKGRFLPIDITSSGLITLDYKFDETFQHPGGVAGNVARHKAWRLHPGPWLQIRTDYQHAGNNGEFAEIILSLPGARYLVDGESWRGAPHWYGEGLNPRVGEFFFKPNLWTRYWIYVTGFDSTKVLLSMWVADEETDPVQLYNDLALDPTEEHKLNEFFLEFDTSANNFPESPVEEMRAWNRNYVAMHNLTKDEVLPLLIKPGKK